VDAQAVPATSDTSSASADAAAETNAPLDASAAGETELASEPSSRKGLHILLFLATALPAAGIVIQRRKSHGSFAFMKMPQLRESMMKMPLLHKFRGDRAEDDMTGYHLQTEEDHGYDILA